MKLTRSQLTHARDVQLAAVGITRTANRGWLKEALAREFTEREIAHFTFATRTTKWVGKFVLSEELPNGIACDDTHNFGRPRLAASGVGTGIIAERFKAGESIAVLAEDYGVERGEIERALRFEGITVDYPDSFPGDSNVEAVKAKMDARARVGYAKYGATTERADFSLLDWLRSAQEESMDQVIYLEAAIRNEEERIARAWECAGGPPKDIASEVPADEVIPAMGSPEAAANELYEKSGRDLS